ncbi:hypothetical protein IU471_12435 [Nocardia elegans]|uniref:Uncharacterized protein n=1 Tax=Nocardia elegans TaxID=300029 RepID=A0ABW6TBI0_9NOCA|nr:hypothetical protein [Nocardia elegans]MBF6244384.1 hypothetical protein [Nocardia elegans]MBF6447958.1 hypothetical protein [Nocardia elegans]
MSAATGPVRDARTLLGMDTRPAWLIAAFYLISEAALSLSSAQQTRHLWPVPTGLAITAAATAALLRIRPDPLPLPATAALAASIPATAALTLFNLPIPPTSVAQLWSFGAGTVTATFMCVRGRTGAAWAGLLSLIATSAVWSWQSGQGFGHGVAISVINLGPLMMATFFAYTLRPAARAIFRLREESTRQVGSEAAAAAALDERRAQVQRLDDMVRPILERIAGPQPLDERTREDCRLIEAHLRDTLRAPALATEPITTAARHARLRGVDVVLIDDHGLDDLPAATRRRVLGTVAAELTTASAGTAHVRILPPHRAILATIVVNDPRSGIRRIEIDTPARPALRPDP